MSRSLNFFLALLALPFVLIPMVLIYLLLLIQNNGTPIFWSKRIGLNSKIFLMPKFRTMYSTAPIVATDLLSNSKDLVTPIGAFLRKSSLDELPQIYSILIGDMNFVGPRPALYNQYDLIELRKALRVDTIRPGLTGLAQISGRDDLPIDEKVRFDALYLNEMSIKFDCWIVLKTIGKVIRRDGIKH